MMDVQSIEPEIEQTVERRFPWFLCSMLFAATALSFLDRQVLSMLAPRIMAEFGLSNTVYSRVVFAFQLSYTAMFALGGYILDRVGTRLGLALSLAMWSFASAAHAFVHGALGLGAARFVLGLGEGACFPGVTKGATELAPASRRTFAIGFANGGSALGAVIAPPLTALLAIRFGWRGAFLCTGLMGAIWLLCWFMAKPATSVVAISSTRTPIAWKTLLRDGRLRKMLFARFLFDPVFYFYMFWIPQFLTRERHLSLEQIGGYIWIPFLVLGFSQVFGGRLADWLAGEQRSPLQSKRLLLSIAAVVTPVSWVASLATNIGWAIGLMSLLMLAHGIWITNYLGLLSDLFPSSAIATIVGLTGTAGGIGGMLSTLAIGPTVDRFSFGPVFAVSGLLYPLALLFVLSASRSRSAVLRSSS
ncbi:MAG: transporter [Acidobacteriaceae bacterium]|nr:transporter [Acidobacteriaceae bacterium]